MINTNSKFWSMLFLFATIWITSADSLYGQTEIKVENSEKYITINKTLEREFKSDAARLALRLKEENGQELRYEDVIIDSNTIKTIYNVLTHVYLNSDTAQEIARYRVHTFPNPSIDHFIMLFDKKSEWAVAYKQGISDTDNEDLIYLMDLVYKYDLIIEKFFKWDSLTDAMRIESKEPLNMEALYSEFYSLEGVREVDSEKIGFSDIQIKKVNDLWEVTYILHFGDKVEDGKHIWKFRINKDNSVSLFEEKGNPIPDWIKYD